MKRVYKSELARAAGVSYKTFQRWLSEHREELEKLGEKPAKHYMDPPGIQYVIEHYHVDQADIERELTRLCPGHGNG